MFLVTATPRSFGPIFNPCLKNGTRWLLEEGRRNEWSRCSMSPNTQKWFSLRSHTSRSWRSHWILRLCWQGWTNSTTPSLCRNSWLISQIKVKRYSWELDATWRACTRHLTRSRQRKLRMRSKRSSNYNRFKTPTWIQWRVEGLVLHRRRWRSLEVFWKARNLK